MRHTTAFPRLLFVIAGFVLSLFHSTISAQSISNYAVTRTTGITYTSILSSGLPPSSWRNSGAYIYDDNRSFPVDIGFDFWYNGARYTEVNVSTNGYVDFSSSTANGGPTTGPYGYSNTQFTASGGTLNSVAPMYDDMTTQGATDPLGSWIRSYVDGVAPNRILTIEWSKMAVFGNTTPSLNFQVKLYETTGQIKYVYGTMTQGTANFSYTCGLNAATVSNNPTAAELKCQQNTSTFTFSNTAQNNLTQIPVSNSQLAFISPTPLNPTGSLTFSGVQVSQMTLNWPNWATNEVGYVIYNSTDNVNWDFITQTTANATNAIITGLYSGTTYYWKVFAVTEGWLSNALLGTQATPSGATFISITTGNWSSNSTWNMNAVPGPNDNVIIANGHTVTINVAGTSCHNITIGQGGTPSVLRFGNNNTARTMTIWGNINVASNGSLTVTTTSNATHQLNLYGNLTNNGTVDFQPDANSLCNLTFLHPYSNQFLNGTGITNRYNLITVNKGTELIRTAEVTTPTFVAPAGFLTLTNGTFKLSTTGAVSITPYNANATIPLHGQLWINSTSATVNTTGGNISLFGTLTISNGTLNIGNATDNNLISNGGLFVVNGGTVNIAGRYERLNMATTSRFKIYGGTLVLNTVGSTSNTSAPFTIDIPGSQYIQTGGTIIIRRYGGTGTTRLGFLNTGGDVNIVTGGVLQIGDALTPTLQTIQINTISPVGALRVASANATALVMTNTLKVINDVEIQFGIFNSNNLNVEVGGNWNNTGGTYTAGTNTTTFNGTTTQLISRTASAENFNHMIFSNAGIKTLGSNINCANITINTGASLNAGTPGFLISTKGNWVQNGSFLAGTSGTVLCNGVAAQTIGGSIFTTFRNLTIQNTAGVSITQHEKILGSLTLTSGIFTTTGFDFTLISNTSGTARIAQITGGDIVGNIIMQRYIFNGPTQWRLMAMPVTGATFQEWNDDIFTCGFPGSDLPNYGFYSIALYNEATLGPKELGYSAPTNVTNVTNPRKGYFVYVGPLPAAIAVKGPPAKMNQSFVVTRTVSAGVNEDGWNLLSNPYPSTIDWDAAAWTRTGTDNVLQIWNPANAQYASYVGGVGVNGGTKYIPSSQAFWVHAIAASPVVGVTEAAKVNVDQTYLHSASMDSLNNLLSLTVHGSMGADQSIVRFHPFCTDSFDVNFDALKLGSMDTTMPYLASVMDSVTDLSISTLPIFNSNITVPLRVNVGVTGNYFITRDSITDLPNSMCVTLEDLLNGNITQLTQGASYSFYISDTTSAPRFLLHFGPSLTVGDVSSSCGNSADGKAFAKGTGNGPWDYVWKDISGSTIAIHNSISGTDTAFGLTPGDYIVDVNGNDGYCSFRSDTITVNGPVPIQTGATMSPATCSYTNDGSLHLNTITGGSSPYVITWPNGSHADSLMNLSVGNYPLIITDANGCIDTAHFTVTTNSTLSAAFTATPDTVVLQSLVSFSNYSSGATSFEWNFGDNSPTSIAANPIYSYSVAGTMTVTLISSDGICQDTATQTVYVFDNTSVPENSLNGNVAVYGGQNSVTVQFNLPSSEHAVVRVYDAAGKLVADQEQQIAQGKMEIPLVNEASEMYSVIVLLPGKTYSSKIVLLK